MPEIDPALQAMAETFADEVADVLNGTIVEGVSVAARVAGDGARFTVGPVDSDTGLPRKMELTVGEHASVRLEVSYSCAWDSAHEYLMVDRSGFNVSVGQIKEPLIRFEYVRDRIFAPAHIQVHGESGALGVHLGAIGAGGHPKLQILHLPVGGKRFRVCLEDVIEFLIKEFHVTPHPEWQTALEEGRERWYRFQLGAAVRSYQEAAVDVLESLGYTITPLAEP